MKFSLEGPAGSTFRRWVIQFNGPIFVRSLQYLVNRTGNSSVAPAALRTFGFLQAHTKSGDGAESRGLDMRQARFDNRGVCLHVYNLALLWRLYTIHVSDANAENGFRNDTQEAHVWKFFAGWFLKCQKYKVGSACGDLDRGCDGAFTQPGG